MHRCGPFQIIKALNENGGYVQLAADQLGMSRFALYSRIRESEELKEALVSARERNREHKLMQAERAWTKLVERDDPHFGAVELGLSRLGKDRGWAPEKQGSHSSATFSFEVKHIIPEAAELGYTLSGALLELPESEEDQPE